MEEENKAVPEKTEEQILIKDYLLGTLSDREKMREIEEKLLLDDEFSERLSLAEDALIEEYLDGELGDAESARFTEFFLVSEERKRNLRLTRNLRKYAGQSKAQAAEPVQNKIGFFDWLLLPATWRFAVVLLFILGGSFALWRVFFFQSETDKGLAQLRAAYRGQRPTEARTSVGFDYASLTPSTRGGNTSNTPSDRASLDRAKLLLFNATENSQNADARHALGLVYLAEKNYDEALKQFHEALKSLPSAKLYNDIGVVYFEKAKAAESNQKGDEFLENINLALENFNRALGLNPRFQETLFNRALVLQNIPLEREARAAWEKYLESDSVSPWAEEARRQLQILDKQTSVILSPEELERNFLTAYRQKDVRAAANLIARNRELIKEKYLPQKIAASLTNVDEKRELLEVLTYAGELEENNAGDLFAKDLALFYRQTADWTILKEAQDALRDSFRLCLENKIKESLAAAFRARALFLQAKNESEAKIAEFLMVYCLIKSDRIKESIPLAQKLADYCRRKNYQWLLANTLYWLAAAQRTTGDTAAAKKNYKDCLSLAEKIGDAPVLQKILISYANQKKFVGQYQDALGYLQRAFGGMTGSAPLNARERWRTYSESIDLLTRVKLYSLAGEVSQENLRLAEESGDPSFSAFSRLDAGIVAARIGDFNAARVFLERAKTDAATIPEEAQGDRTELLAKSLLTLGDLEKRSNDYAKAARYYDEALEAVQNSEVPALLYETEKARLEARISLKPDGDAAGQIAETVKLAERYRREIADEEARSSFFDSQQNIYDIAVENEFRQGRYESAYHYLEISNARSLLDWLWRGVRVQDEKTGIEINFKDTVSPLTLGEIRARMPEETQILQYAVLADRVLIWVVSREDFVVSSVSIPQENLNEKVTRYASLVSDPNQQQENETETLARELYELLVKPVEDRLNPQRRICLIPQKTLFHLPFAPLVSTGDSRTFLERFEFFYASSANIFLLCTKKAAGKTPTVKDEFLLSVGNPRFDRAEFAGFPDLPDAETEAREIAALYLVSQTLVGTEATKEAFTKWMSRAEVINFAGHYLVRGGEPLASGLLLTGTGNADDGLLTNSELIRLRIERAKLVILSACQTGSEHYYHGEGMVGLSTTFLKAGVPLVVASQWAVNSAATAELMKKFHVLRRRDRLSSAAALRRAQLEMMHDEYGDYRHPYYWAAFAAYGGDAKF